MFVSIICFVSISTLFVVSAFNDDYFNRKTILESSQLICNSQTENECLKECGEEYRCAGKTCFCGIKRLLDDEDNPARVQNEIEHPRAHSDDEPTILDVTFSLHSVVERQPLRLEEPKYPTLRHHIAHFCPNLGVARTCIRTCMKLGKPAFCGKDHECYCGHRYSPHDKDKYLNLADMYAEFKDMYAKYFGPNTGTGIGETDNQQRHSQSQHSQFLT